MWDPALEIKKIQDAEGVCEDHKQVHLSIKKCLSPEDQDEFDESKWPEEDADDIDSTLHILVLLCCVIIAEWYRDIDMLCSSLVYDCNGYHL